jgi:hypothetical protein
LLEPSVVRCIAELSSHVSLLRQLVAAAL